MRRKRVIITILTVVTILLIAIFALKLPHRIEASKYLEDTYSEKFNLSLIPKEGNTDLGTYYWDASSKESPTKSFKISYFEDGTAEYGQNSEDHYIDTYETDMLKGDLREYYQATVNRTWENAMLNLHSCNTPNKVYDTCNDYLQNNIVSVEVYVKHDSRFNYDVEAEKILKLINSEDSDKHKMFLNVFYIKSAEFTKLPKDKLPYFSSYSQLETNYKYPHNLNEKIDTNTLTKETIIEDMKNNKDRISKMQSR